MGIRYRNGRTGKTNSYQITFHGVGYVQTPDEFATWQVCMRNGYKAQTNLGCLQMYVNAGGGGSFIPLADGGSSGPSTGSVTASYTFDGSLQGLQDGNRTASMTVSYEPNDGSPSPGCVKFAGDGQFGTSETAYDTGKTWESFGVPAGATVTSIALTDWRVRYVTIPPDEHGYDVTVEVVHSSPNQPSVTGSVLGFISNEPAGPWRQGNTYGNQSVLPEYRASNTPISLRILFTFRTGDILGWDVRVDNIVLQINYTLPGGGGPPPMPEPEPNGCWRLFVELSHQYGRFVLHEEQLCGNQRRDVDGKLTIKFSTEEWVEYFDQRMRPFDFPSDLGYVEYPPGMFRMYERIVGDVVLEYDVSVMGGAGASYTGSKVVPLNTVLYTFYPLLFAAGGLPETPGWVPIPWAVIYAQTDTVTRLGHTAAASVTWTSSRPIRLPSKASGTSWGVTGGTARTYTATVGSTGISSTMTASSADGSYVRNYAYALFTPACDLQWLGDFYKYDTPYADIVRCKAWELATRVVDIFSTPTFKRNWIIGEPGGTWTPEWNPDTFHYVWDETQFDSDANGRVNRMFSPEFWLIYPGIGDDDGVVPAGGFITSRDESDFVRYTYQPIGIILPKCYLIRSEPWDVARVFHLPEVLLDNTGDASQWSGPNVTVTQQPGNIIRASTGILAGSLHRNWSPARDCRAHRYWRMNMRVVGSTNATIELEFQTALFSPIVKRWWLPLVGDGIWIDFLIDLLNPDRFIIPDPLGDVEIDSRVEELQELGPRTDLFGIFKLSTDDMLDQMAFILPPNTTIEFSDIRVVSDPAQLPDGNTRFSPTGQRDKVAWGTSDKKLAFNDSDLYFDRSLRDLRLEINEYKGWLASLPGRDVVHDVFNLDGPVLWVGGGMGFIWEGDLWSNEIDVQVPSAGYRLRAQANGPYLFPYPGIASEQRFIRPLFARATGFVFRAGEPAPGTTVYIYREAFDSYPSSPVATVQTDGDGSYEALIPPQTDAEGFLVGIGSLTIEVRRVPPDTVDLPHPLIATWIPAESGSTSFASFWVKSVTKPFRSITADTHRGWVHITDGNVVHTYDVADWTKSFASPAYTNIATWKKLQVDTRRGRLYMLGQNGTIWKVYRSDDGGRTAVEAISVTAATALIQHDSERGILVLFYTDTNGFAWRRESLDGGVTWSAAEAILGDGEGQPTGVLMDITHDPRRGNMVLVFDANSVWPTGVQVRESFDLGRTWKLRLS